VTAQDESPLSSSDRGGSVLWLLVGWHVTRPDLGGEVARGGRRPADPAARTRHQDGILRCRRRLDDQGALVGHQSLNRQLKPLAILIEPPRFNTDTRPTFADVDTPRLETSRRSGPTFLLRRNTRPVKRSLNALARRDSPQPAQVTRPSRLPSRAPPHSGRRSPGNGIKTRASSRCGRVRSGTPQ
jgi:hypothetical protein